MPFDPQARDPTDFYDPTTQNPFEYVQLVALGDAFDGWESVTVTREAQQPYVTAQLTASEVRKDGMYPDPQGDAFTTWNFPPGAEVTMYASGKPFLTGYVNAYMPSATPEQHSVTVSFTTRSRDWAESSVNFPTGNFEEMPDTAIMQALAAASGHSISLGPGVMPEIVPSWQVRQGAANAPEGIRLMQPRRKIITNGPGPDAPLYMVGPEPFYVNEKGNLIQGWNILQMSAKLLDNKSDRTVVMGQPQADETDFKALQTFGIARIPRIFADSYSNPRERFRLIVDQESSTAALAQARATWEALRSAGNDTEAIVLVPGWRDQAGTFWQPYTDTYLNAPYLQISCWMRIKKCVYRQSLATGTTTEITLVDPRVYGGPTLACNSSPVWQGAYMPEKGTTPEERRKKGQSRLTEETFPPWKPQGGR